MLDLGDRGMCMGRVGGQAMTRDKQSYRDYPYRIRVVKSTGPMSSETVMVTCSYSKQCYDHVREIAVALVESGWKEMPFAVLIEGHEDVDSWSEIESFKFDGCYQFPLDDEC